MAQARSQDKAESSERPTSRNVLSLAGLLEFFRPHLVPLTSVLLLLGVSSSAELAIGYAVRDLVDRGIERGGAALDRHFLILFGIILVFAAATFVRFYLITWLAERVIAELRGKVYGHVIRLSPAFFETTKTGEIISRLVADTTMIQTVVTITAPIALRGIFLLVGGTVMMLLTSVKLTAMVLIATPLLVIPLVMYSRRVRRLARQNQDRVADVSSVAEEGLSAALTVQAFTREDRDTEHFRAAAENAYQAAMQYVRSWATLNGVGVMFFFSVILVVLWVGAKDMLRGDMNAGELSAFVIYSVLISNAFGSLSQVWGQLQRAAGATERLTELLQTRSAIEPPIEPSALPSPVRGEISFEDVTFAYPSRPGEPSLADFALDVRPGETVALVGPSGAGKSTVFKLLLRFYDPQSGSVRLDGVDLRETDPVAVRRQISLVPQDPVIFTTTARENIAYGRPDATEAEILAAAEAAAARSFIEALPQGFDTELGYKGARLSGGQKQRIAIARAILRDSSVLLFDEATSSLDSESERLVHAALERLAAGRTTLIIAHRLATVLGADRIVVMDRGRIVAAGTHFELIEQDGLYAQLAKLQFDTSAEALSARSR